MDFILRAGIFILCTMLVLGFVSIIYSAATGDMSGWENSEQSSCLS